METDRPDLWPEDVPMWLQPKPAQPAQPAPSDDKEPVK